MMALKHKSAIKILHSEEPIEYSAAMLKMDTLRDEVTQSQDLTGYIWFLEHNDVFTIGTSGSQDDIIDAHDIPVIETNRGGKITYHGIGQRVIYLILNLKKLYDGKPDLRRYVHDLAEATIRTLADFGINARADSENIGVWVNETKIASIGVRIKNWVTTHGIAINISPNLEHFSQIIPCGLSNVTMSSTQSLGATITKEEFDKHFLQNFYNLLATKIDPS